MHADSFDQWVLDLADENDRQAAAAIEHAGGNARGCHLIGWGYNGMAAVRDDGAIFTADGRRLK